MSAEQVAAVEQVAEMRRSMELEQAEPVTAVESTASDEMMETDSILKKQKDKEDVCDVEKQNEKEEAGETEKKEKEDDSSLEKKQEEKEKVWKAYSKSLKSFAEVLEENNRYLQDIAVKPHKEIFIQIVYLAFIADLQQETAALKNRAALDSDSINGNDLERYKKMTESINGAIEEWKEKCSEITATRQMTIEEVLPLFGATMKKLNYLQARVAEKIVL